MGTILRSHNINNLNFAMEPLLLNKKLIQFKKYQLVDCKRDYNYSELLDRFLQNAQEKNFQNIFCKKLFIPPPKLGRDGTKKTIFLNFEQISIKLNRKKEHLFLFLEYFNQI
jgi:hypothetical protein